MKGKSIMDNEIVSRQNEDTSINYLAAQRQLYNEAKNLLNNLGFYENNKGKTSGSRVVFINKDLNKYIEIHKPHPSNILKPYQVNSIIKLLEEWRIL